MWKHCRCSLPHIWSEASTEDCSCTGVMHAGWQGWCDASAAVLLRCRLECCHLHAHAVHFTASQTLPVLPHALHGLAGESAGQSWCRHACVGSS